MERNIERYLVNKVKSMGGLALKWVSPGYVGVPDRIVLLPNGKTFFAECKDTDGRLSPIQAKRIRKLESLGAKVFVVNSKEQIDEMLEEVIS